MADTIRGTIEDAGHAVVEVARGVAGTVGETAGRAADWVKEKTGLGAKPEVDPAAIRPHMDVVSSCGCKMGSVDHLEGNAIKLTLKDSIDGLHHYVPVGMVARVDEHVHLTTNKADTKTGWKPTAAGCAACG